MSKSNGMRRKIIKIMRIPFIIFYKFKGLKIPFNSSFPIRGTIFENPKYINIGKHCNFDKFTKMRCFSIDGKFSTIKIGDNFCGGDNLKILCGAPIIIGDNLSVAGNVLITSENHGLNPQTKSFNDNPLSGAPIEIGDGVWIGENVIILPGVKIGEKSVIGAGSVVTKNVPSYCIAVGNPAKVIKRWDFNLENYVSIE